jgi:hypothetical protein
VTAARWIFAAAGIYGLIVLLPLFFIEPWLAPAPSRPEDYYGFLGAATAFQFVYLTIARDPVRFRPLMAVAVLAKAFFFITTLLLWREGRAAGPAIALASIDGAIGLGFAYAWWRTPAARG